MRLDAFKGKGDVTAYTLSVNGRPVTTLVNDPANAAPPAQPVKEWLTDVGGTAPLIPPERTATDGNRT